MTKATKFLLSLMLMMSISLTGCSSEEVTEYDPAKDPLVDVESMYEVAPENLDEVDLNESLIVQIRSEPKTLTPLFVSSTYEFIAMNLLTDMMFLTANDEMLTVYANPDVVESWEETPDHKVITVKLRKDLKWHDGQPVTAHDFVFTWQSIMDEAVPCQTFKTSAKNIENVEALDDHTIRYTMNKALATRLSDISSWIIPKHLFEKDKEANPDLLKGEYYSNLARNPVGFGPYKLAKWETQDRLVFERWEDYPGKKPYLKRIVLKIIAEPSNALMRFKAGDIDLIMVMTPRQCARETSDKDFAAVGLKHVYHQWGYGYIGWNLDKSNPFFIDKKVRTAMAHAMNRKYIADKLLYKLSELCSGMYHPTAWMYNKDIKMIDFDLEKASQLLDEAGWNMGSDGWRYRDVKYALVETTETKKKEDGTEDISTSERRVYLLDDQEYNCEDNEKILKTGTDNVKFEFTVLVPGTGNPPAVPLIYQMDLQKIGVKLKIRMLEWTSFMQRTLKHDMQAWMAGWGAGSDPDGGRNLWVAKEYKTGRNYGGYNNPRVDELYLAGMKEFDREKRAQIYQEIHKLHYEDQPYLFLFDNSAISAVHKRLRGVEKTHFDILGSTDSLRNIWVKKGEAIRVAK